MVSAKAVALKAEIKAKRPEPPPGVPDGTEDNPFLISTPEDLSGLRDFLGEKGAGQYFKVTNEIDLTGYLSPDNPDYNDGAGWLPIGAGYPNFAGNLDGGGHKITGLWINRPETEHIGLFGRINNGIVENLGVKISEKGIKGKNYIGGLSGSIGNGTIRNCYTTGNLSGSAAIGGLIGYSGGDCSNIVIIENCYATGDIFAERGFLSGGLVGYSGNSGTIEKCYASGNVSTGVNYLGCVGGLIGSADWGTIKNSFARGSVTTAHGSNRGVGGFVGIAGEYGPVNIENCYATGLVSGDGILGGFIGERIDAGITACFFDNENAGLYNGVGSGPDDGVSGRIAAELHNIYTFLNAGWDFTAIWAMNESINAGYPYLRAIPPA